MIKLALTFPIHNGLELTKKCLSNLHESSEEFKKNGILRNIIIVDDGSTDNSYNWIKKNYPKIILIKGDGNLWWSGGVNKGIHYAFDILKCEYVLLWNNDIITDKNYFSSLSEILKKADSNTIICSKIYSLTPPNIIISAGGIFNPRSGKYYLRGFGMTDCDDYNKIFQADWFGGMGTTIPKRVFDTIGYFNDKKFPQYHGDSDFGLRAKKAGVKLLVFPNLKIWNDRKSTGYSNTRTFIIFIKSLFTLKSNNNIYREFLFYKSHAESLLAYRRLIAKYIRHIGGYFKWKIKGIFGLKRDQFR